MGEFVIEKIEIFYTRVKGSYFFFIGVAISIISIIISIVLYTAGGATYSILTNYVSDLGATTAPNNASIAFNMGLIINSILSPFGSFFLVIIFQNKGIKQNWIIWLWFSANIISTIATFFVAIFPEDTMLLPHNFAAFVTFAFLMLYNLIYGVIALLADKIAAYHSIPAFVLVLINIIFMISYASNLYEPVVTVLEWMVLFGGWAFGLYLGFFTLKAR
ncbi:MAG: DUF998 domain-containing protein [Promethearchaeota archaeon]|nr:MAG: DUF998 domain-containing protein [Candidatus Lokiarchaeota archaeon]